MGLFSFSDAKKNKSKSKRSRSISHSDPPSFGSTATSDTSTTPRTVLRRPPSFPRNDEYWSSSFTFSADLSLSPNLRIGLDGKITKHELEQVLRRLGSGGEDEVAELLSEADRDGDGMIRIEDLLLLPQQPEIEAMVPAAEDDEEELRETFKVYDADGDGRISAEELREVFLMIGDESCSLDDCRRMISVVDSQGDGYVCFPDFAKMMMTTDGRRSS